MTSLDLVVMAVYFAMVLAVGGYFAGKGNDADSYFLGRHQLPWWAVMLSIVATETSALTVISIPGIGARGDMTFIQVAIGYLIGRIGVSIWLLPGYFEGSQQTAYARLETRFGPQTRRMAASVFMLIRSLGDSVRVAATAIPLSIVTGWPILVSVVVIAAVTVVYTWAGGLRAVVWVDVVQLAIYTVGGVATIVIAATMAGGFTDAVSQGLAAGKLRAFDWSLSWSIPYTFAAGLIGGGLLSAASHGTDHLIVQRILATANLTAARKALIGSGILVIMQFVLFLLVGTMLWAAGADDPAIASDRIYPQFIVAALPSGLAGLVVAGVLAAAMSTVSSSLNSLASVTTHDFYAAFARTTDPKRLLVFGRWATLGWALVLVGGALALQSDQPVVELALSIASITYGSLLGTYVLGGISTRIRQRDAIRAIVVSSVAMVLVVFVEVGPLASLAWPWYVPLGTLITLAVGLGSAAVQRPATT